MRLACSRRADGKIVLTGESRVCSAGYGARDRSGRKRYQSAAKPQPKIVPWHRRGERNCPSCRPRPKLGPIPLLLSSSPSRIWQERSEPGGSPEGDNVRGACCVQALRACRPSRHLQVSPKVPRLGFGSQTYLRAKPTASGPLALALGWPLLFLVPWQRRW